MAYVMSKRFIRRSIGSASLLASALLLSFGANWANAQTAQTYTSPTDGFQVDFPGTVKVTPQNTNDPVVARANYYVNEGTTAVYAIMAMLYKSPESLSSESLSPFNNYKCTTTTRKTLQFAQGQALQLSGINCMGANLSAVTNYYIAGDWFYQVTAVFPPTDADGAAAQQFLASFKVANAVAPVVTWKTYTSAADGFQVDFSGAVKVTPTHHKNLPTSPVRETVYAENGGNFTYGVAAVLYSTPVANFGPAIKEAFAANKCKPTSQSSVQVSSGQAAQYSGTDCLGGRQSALVRYFTVADWYYQVSAYFPPDDADAANAAHFVDSFKITAH